MRYGSRCGASMRGLYPNARRAGHGLGTCEPPARRRRPPDGSSKLCACDRRAGEGFADASPWPAHRALALRPICTGPRPICTAPLPRTIEAETVAVGVSGCGGWTSVVRVVVKGRVVDVGAWSGRVVRVMVMRRTASGSVVRQVGGVDVGQEKGADAVDDGLGAAAGVAAQDVAGQPPRDRLARAGDDAVAVAIDVEHDARGLDHRERRHPVGVPALPRDTQLAREPGERGARALLRLDAGGAHGPRLLALLQQHQRGAAGDAEQRRRDQHVRERHARSVRREAATRQRPMMWTSTARDVRRRWRPRRSATPGSRAGGSAAGRPSSRAVSSSPAACSRAARSAPPRTRARS